MGLRLHWLYITPFLDLLGTSLLVPFLPVHLRAHGLPRLAVGIITSVYPSVQLFSSPAVGLYSNRYGQKCTLITSLVLCSLAYYLLACTTSISVIFLCRVFLGIVKHSQTVCKAVFLSQDETYFKTVEFGRISAAEAVGFMLGPVIGAHFIGREEGFQCLCKITTALFFINALIVFLVLPVENQVINRSINKIENVVSVFGERKFIDFPLFWDILVLKLILCLSLSLFYINYHVIVVEYLNMSPSMVGYTSSFQGLMCVIVCLFSTKISSFYLPKQYYLKLSFCFLLLSSSFFCIDLISNSVTFVICLIPLSCSSSLLRIYLTEALVSLSDSNDKAHTFGLENSIATIASLTSPFVFEFFNYLNLTPSIANLAFLISGFGSLFSLVLCLSKEKDNLCLYQNMLRLR